MKRIFWYLISAIVMLQGCSMNNEDWELNSSDKLTLPPHIENFGKAVANQIQQTVKNLNEKGVDYSNASNTPEFKKQFFQDWIQASPEMKITETDINQMFVDEQAFVDGLRNLTHIQVKFINRILKACGETMAYDNFGDRLAEINKDIYKQVPQIEQERLFYIISVLYFGIREIQNLEKQGQMLVTPQNKFQMTRIKTKGEPGGESGTCREVLSAVAIGVIGEITKAGEIIVSISKVLIGGVAMVMTVLCVSDTDPRPSCTRKYTECMSTDNKYSKPNSNGWGDTLCAACLRACIGNGGIWNCN